MFSLRWYNGRQGEAVTANPESAWEIYWALKKGVEKARTMEDYYITIYFHGIPCNPERGGKLPLCREGEGPVFILKKAEKE